MRHVDVPIGSPCFPLMTWTLSFTYLRHCTRLIPAALVDSQLSTAGLQTRHELTHLLNFRCWRLDLPAYPGGQLERETRERRFAILVGLFGSQQRGAIYASVSVEYYSNRRHKWMIDSTNEPRIMIRAGLDGLGDELTFK